MQSISPETRQWLIWCHQGQPRDAVLGAMETVARMAKFSPFEAPVLVAHCKRNGGECVGYAIACEGAIGVLGSVRYQPKEQTSSSPSPNGKSPTGEYSEEAEPVGFAEDAWDAMGEVVALLSDQAFAKGVELVQAILPIDRDGWVDTNLSLAYELGGLRRIATLNQMECEEAQLWCRDFPPASEVLPLRFEPFDAMPWNEWCDLVEQTYCDTLDVPELNGLRSIANTLKGYAAGGYGYGQGDLHRPWWSAWLDGKPVGCLLLTPLSESTCELTYLGLIPEARGHRYSPEIMDFIGRWMVAENKHRVVLAVDSRNAPAIHLYRGYGFRELQSLQAWIAVPPKG